MSKYKRVWATLGVVGMLCALLALSAASPTPAGADDGPDNRINITKLVLGTFDGVGNVFGLGALCDDPDGNGPLPVGQFGGDVPTTGGTVNLSIPAAYRHCRIFELNEQNSDNQLIQATTPTPNLTNVVIGNGANALNNVSNYVDFAAGGDQQVDAFIANSYTPHSFGRVQITKDIVGAVPAGAIFQMEVTCAEDSVNGGPNQVTPARVYDVIFLGEGTQTVNVATTGDVLTVAGNQNPAACTPIVDENVAQPVPVSVAYDPAAANIGGLNTLPASSQDVLRLVTVTNTYLGPVNRITVAKNVVGTPPAGTQHRIAIFCFDEAQGPPSQNNPNAPFYSTTYAMNGGESHVFDVPANLTVCQTTETNHAWQGNTEKIPDSVSIVTFPVGGVVVYSAPGPCPSQAPDATQYACSIIRFRNGDGGNTANIQVTNRYIAGPFNRITVDKATTGTVPAGSLFLVRIHCNTPLSTNPTVNDYYMTFGSGLPQTQSVNWPVGGGGGNPRDCEVREINSAGAVSVSYASGPSSPGTLLHVQQNPGGNVDIGWATNNGENAQVNIVNRFNPKTLPDNTLRIKKQLRGRASSGPFTIEVRCSGGGITDTRILTFTTNSFQEITVPALRSDCRVVETANGGAQSVSYFASSATADATDGPLSARVNFGTVVGGQRGKVIVRNQFPGTCPRPGPKFC